MKMSLVINLLLAFLLTGCTVIKARIDIKNVSDIPIPEKKALVYISSPFWRLTLNVDNDWITYSDNADAYYHVEIERGLTYFKERSSNKLLTFITMGMIPYCRDTSRTVVIANIFDKRNNFSTYVPIGSTTESECTGWLSVFQKNYDDIDALEDKKIEIASIIAHELDDINSKFIQEKKARQNKKIQREKALLKDVDNNINMILEELN